MARDYSKRERRPQGRGLVTFAGIGTASRMCSWSSAAKCSQGCLFVTRRALLRHRGIITTDTSSGFSPVRLLALTLYGRRGWYALFASSRRHRPCPVPIPVRFERLIESLSERQISSHGKRGATRPLRNALLYRSHAVIYKISTLPLRVLKPLIPSSHQSREGTP